MPLRFQTQYLCKRLDNLGDPEWHNSRWQDIDLRMAARELDAKKIDNAVDQMEAIALARLNDTFSPLIREAMDQLASVGVSFTGVSHTTQTIGVGIKTFIIDDDFKTGMVVVDYVSIRPTGVSDTAMICSVDSYDRVTGALVVDPQAGYITGSGTYSDWQIRVSVTPNLDTYSRAEVDDKIQLADAALIDGAPDNMNTLGKLAAAIGGTAGQITGPGTAVLLRANNLSDLISAATARANLGLGNVNNTADANKPVSGPQSAAIAAVVAAVFPTGTQMIFAQAVVPTGWIKSSTHNDKTIRIVNSTGGGSGGVQAWSTVFGRTTVDYHTLDGNELTYHAHGIADPGHGHGIGDPSHNHSFGDPNAQYLFTYPGQTRMASGGDQFAENIQNGATPGGGVSYSGTGIWIGGAGTGIGIYAAGANYGHTHGIDLRCQYVDVLIGIKS